MKNILFSESDLAHIQTIFTLALEEDRVGQDATSHAVFCASDTMSANIVAREQMVFSGAEVLPVLMQQVESITLALNTEDGTKLESGAIIGAISGPTIQLLSLERTILNTLQRLCGVATLTRRYVDAVAGTNAVILDTRKTIPGWRVLDKYAVRCGGGQNHRMHLADAIMLKDNHIAGFGAQDSGFGEIVEKAKRAQPNLPIIIECDTLEQVKMLLSFWERQAFSANAMSAKKAGEGPHPNPLPRGEGVISRILLDNMPLETLKKATQLVAGRIPLEASGGVNLDTVGGIAQTGVDYISVGAITHSAKAVDIGLDF